MTTGPAADTYSYGTLTPPAQRTPSKARQQRQSSSLAPSAFDTPTSRSGGMHSRTAYEAAGSDEDDEVLKGEGEFSEDVDDRTIWMRNGRQGKATVASCVSK